MSRARRLTIAVAAVGMLISAAAGAQEYPTKPITLIVPWPAGGSTDISMRAIAESASKLLGQPIAIDNKAGGGGTVGPATMAAAARPDGYTIAQIPITVFRFPFMQKTTFDPAVDFTYIIGVSGYTFGVVVKDDAPWKTFQELIAEAKASPGKINYGTPGTGTSLHIAMEQIAKRQGVTNPNNTVVLQVLVTRSTNRGSADAGKVDRLPDEARIITVKTRKAT